MLQQQQLLLQNIVNKQENMMTEIQQNSLQLVDLTNRVNVVEEKSQETSCSSSSSPTVKRKVKVTRDLTVSA
jgi:uncharacterized membrane protein YfhO